ncbi:MAG: hypothetical protein PWQ93_757 [Clostridiales bacterium]|nr:hypothetical protein [Clostridiales bacterium]
MADYLLRNDAPLTKEQWDSVDKAVVEGAKAVLVGRKFIPLFGPVGAGTFVVPNEEANDGADMKLVKLNMLCRDFVYGWREIQYFEESNLPLNTGKAFSAAAMLAADEDRLVFYGDAEKGAEGILTVGGKLSYARNDWQKGSAYDDVVAVLALLRSHYQFGPYVMVTSPPLFAALNKVYKDTPYLDAERIERLGVKLYQSPVLKDEDAFIVSANAQSIDLVIGQDIITAFVETADMNHRFRILETLGLRIKRADSIVALTYREVQ